MVTTSLVALLAVATHAAPVEEARLEAAPAPERRPFNKWIAALEMGVAVGIGATWYQTQIEVNKVDFDFGRTFRDQWRRLTTSDGYRFDDNETYLNVGHAMAGLYYHQFARANNASMLQAYAFSLATSSLWELTVEHREVFSLNDTITTTVGGVSLGESTHRLGDYFARSAPSVRNTVLMAAFSPARAVAELTDGERRRARADVDARGLATDAHRQFELSLGAAWDTTPGAPATAVGATRLDLELFDLRSYGRPGQVQRRLHGGESVRLLVDYVGTRDDLQSLTFATRTTLFGSYSQDLRGEAGDLRGRSTLLAAASAFDLSYDDAGAFTDFLTAVHLLGPTADVSFHRGPLALRLASDLFGDFAMVRPFALDAAPSLDGTKSVLRRNGYYYALGVTAAARAEARYRRGRAGASVEWNGYDSIEGLDRHQNAYTSPTGRYHEAVEDDFSIVDTRAQLRVYADVPVPYTPATLGINLAVKQRGGELQDHREEQTDSRVAVVLTGAL